MNKLKIFRTKSEYPEKDLIFCAKFSTILRMNRNCIPQIPMKEDTDMPLFLKENSYNIVKCLLNQVAVMLLGLMLAFATWQNKTLLLLASLFSIAFYLFITYYMFWEIGGKDRIRVDGGRQKPQLWKGFAICMTANLLNLLLAVLLLATYRAAETNGTAADIYAVCNILARGFESMYLGLIQTVCPEHPIIFLLIVFPAPIVAEIAYLFGHRNFRIAGLFGIKQNLKDETR